MHHGDLLSAIAVSVISATALAFIARFLKLPLLVAYIVAGVVIGPKIGFGWVQSEEQIQSISEIGLILLLFIIGLEIDLKKLFKAGKAVAITGLLQAPIAAAITAAILWLVGFRNQNGQFELFYLSFGLSISSTMIVVKALYEKHELDTIAGRITLGVLVFQDIWAIIFLAVQPNLQNPEVLTLLGSFGKGVALVVFCLLLSKYVLPSLFNTIAKMPEFMLVASLAWCFLVASLATLAGLSKEMGALIAGLSISTFPYNLDVVAKVINIRDFFIMLFLVALGMAIPMPTVGILLAALGLTAIVLISRLISVFPVLMGLGEGPRVSLVSSLNLAQVSEFSLVAFSIGLGFNHISDETVSVIVFTLVITAVLSTYCIKQSHGIYLSLVPVFKKLGWQERIDAEDSKDFHTKGVFILGFFKYASALVHQIETTGNPLKNSIRVIDYNPTVLQKIQALGFDGQYGDISHFETLHHLGIEHAEVIISTVPDSLLKGTSNMNILKSAKKHAPKAKVIVISEDVQYAVDLYNAGADYVVIPRIRVSEQLTEILEKSFSWRKEGKETQSYKELMARSEILP
ncbi:MAG: cation:proton antiporter [Chloroherpetonaceae bacterium]|nr:cation:proton antiporter [Chloroherpetonaceae bacterium]